MQIGAGLAAVEQQPLMRISTRTHRSLLRAAPPIRHPWQVVLIFCAAYLGVILALNDFDVKTFVTIGSCYSSCEFDLSEGCPAGTENGYDGQYAYYIARNPGGAAGCMDVAAYRYQRILLPALGYVFSFGSDTLIPAVFVTANLIALLVGVRLLGDLLAALGVSRWYALVYGLFFGTVVGVRLSTVEPLAYGLVIAAVWEHQQPKPRIWLQALLLLAAALTKETTLPFAAAFILYAAVHRRWAEALRLGLVVGVPFIVWQAALYAWLGAPGIGSGGGGATPFEVVPYNGVWRIFTETGNLAVFLVVGSLAFGVAVLPSLWGLWATLREFWQRRADAHFYAYLHAVNAALMAFVPFSTYREFLGIFRFVVPLVLTHLLFAGLRYRGRRALIYSTLWLLSLLFVVAG